MLNHLLCHDSIQLKERCGGDFKIPIQYVDDDMVMPCNDDYILFIHMRNRDPGFDLKLRRLGRFGFEHHQKIILHACTEGNALDIGFWFEFKLRPEIADGYFRYMTFGNGYNPI